MVTPLQLEEGERAPGVIYEYVRQLILEGALPPLAPISQVQLARSLGVSRTPLREALRRLQQEGLVVAEPNRRVRVVGFDPDDLEIVYAARLFYEPLGLFLTVPELTDEDVRAIERALADMRSSSETNEYARWERAHRRFHDGLALHAPESLKRTIATHAERGTRYRRLYQSDISHSWNVGDAAHQAIYEACRERNREAAATELARHLGTVALSLMARAVPEREPAVLRAALLMTGPPARATRR